MSEAVDSPRSQDVQRMPRLSAQQKLDEERGISATPLECFEGAVRLGIGGPEWLVKQIAQVGMLTLQKMGYSIVPTEAKREG